MTTNQTIDGVLVPRELAKRLAVPMLRTPEYLFDHRDALDELRALLDAADHVHEWDINSEGTATVCHCGARSSDEPAEPPAPVAVVLPERLAMIGRGLMDAQTVSHHLGWNACLDELKRLNDINQ